MPNKLIEKIILSISKILNEPIKNVTMASKSDDFNRWDRKASIAAMQGKAGK